jgi:hypothetical protein
MQRPVFLLAVAGAIALLIIAPAGAFLDDTAPAEAVTPEPSEVLPTASVSAAALPGDPDVVTDADLATAGAQRATIQVFDDPNQLVVDDDLAQCPNADFTTPTGIQQAIEAASPGDKIKVCPGTYSPINVHKADLWLQAPRTQGSANQCREGNPAQDAFIEGSDALGLVQIVASGVRLEGFIVQGNPVGPGIRTDATGSGYELSFNEIRLNHYGVDLNTSGPVPTLLTHNCLRENDGLGVGILSSTGFSNVAMENNFFSGHSCAAMFNGFVTPQCFVGTVSPASNAAFSHNTLVDDSTAQFNLATNVAIAYNEWLRPFGASVILNGTIGAVVTFNHIDGEHQQPPGSTGQGIFVGGEQGLALDVLVRSNKIENLCCGIFIGPNLLDSFGIMVTGSGVSVLTNWVQFNRGTGINLRSPLADGNRIEGNLVVGNGIPGTDARPRGSDGIRINAGAVGNTIENNRLGEPLQGADPAERANRDHDCHDNNPNGVNHWRHNVGYTENQPGLCVRRQ